MSKGERSHLEMVFWSLAIRVYILLIERVSYFIELPAASCTNVSPARVLDLDALASQ